MKLILGFGGGGSGYYPYTQKPVDYQPYRPVYLFRGPPPDAGFSYGLFEDEEVGKKYYADLGLDSFSPLSGKSSKLLEELSPQQVERMLGDDLKTDNLQKSECPNCSSEYFDNFHLTLKGRDDFFCHRCGGKLPLRNKKADAVDVKDDDMSGSSSQAAAAPQIESVITKISQDPDVLKFVTVGLDKIKENPALNTLSDVVALRLTDKGMKLTKDQVKHGILIAFKNAIK